MTITRLLSRQSAARSALALAAGPGGGMRRFLFAMAASSFGGNKNSALQLLPMLSGGQIDMLKNTGLPTATSTFIADRIGIICDYNPDLVGIQLGRNTLSGQTAASLTQAQTDTKRAIAFVRARGIPAIVLSEYHDQQGLGNATGSVEYYIEQFNAWLPTYVASLNDPLVMFFDAASYVASSSGVPVGQQTVTATFTNGATTFTCSTADAAKLGQGGLLMGTGIATGVSGGKSIAYIDNTTSPPTVHVGDAFTADGSAGVQLTWAPYYMNALHPNTAGNKLIAAGLLSTLQTAGLVGTASGGLYPNSATDTDNFFQNGTFEGSVTNGAAANWTPTNPLPSGVTPSVAAAPSGRGNAQTLTCAPGAAACVLAQNSLTRPSAAYNTSSNAAPAVGAAFSDRNDVACQRTKMVRFYAEVTTSGWFTTYAAGNTSASLSALWGLAVKFDTSNNGSVVSSDASTNVDGLDPVKVLSGCDMNGSFVVCGYARVPADASYVSLVEQTSAIPTWAPANCVISLANVKCSVVDDPLLPIYKTRPTRSLTAATTILPSDDVVRFTAAAAISQALPTAASMLHQSVTFKNVGTSAASLTLTAASGETIDGAASLVIAAGASARLHASAALLWEAL